MILPNGALGSVLVWIALFSTVAKADWIDPPSRPWKIQAQLAFPFADFSMKSGDSDVSYRIVPSLVPSISFGWKFLKVGISKKLSFSDNASDMSSFRLGVNQKYYVVDFAFHRTKGMRTNTAAGVVHRPDLGYLMAGFNAFGGVSFSGDIPYSVQSYYGSVEVPDGVEFDVTGFANLNWNSLNADAPIVPAEKAAAFGSVASLKGFRSLALNTGVGLGVTLPLGDQWLISSMALAGLSFLAGSHVYLTDNDYSADVGNQLGLRAALLYRHENHTWSFAGYIDRWMQSIQRVGFRQDFKGVSASYAFRF